MTSFLAGWFGTAVHLLGKTKVPLSAGRAHGSKPCTQDELSQSGLLFYCVTGAINDIG